MMKFQMFAIGTTMGGVFLMGIFGIWRGVI
jgi:hypothetical protein